MIDADNYSIDADDAEVADNHLIGADAEVADNQLIDVDDAEVAGNHSIDAG